MHSPSRRGPTRIRAPGACGARRLRSLLRVVAGLTGAEKVAPIVQELQWFATELGAARDRDVFATQTLAAVSRAIKDPRSRRDIGIVRGHITRMSRAHVAEAAAAAASPRLQRLLLSVSALLAALDSPAAVPAARMPARSLGKDTLEARARRLNRRGKHLPRASPTERHQVRIAAKKLRYVAELFAPLFPGSRTKDYLSALSGLQEALGHLNDLATGERIVDELGIHGRTQHFVHGSGIARGWLSGAETAALRDAGRAWRKFAKAKPFWH
jgi:CHAD domain-containing protein